MEQELLMPFIVIIGIDLILGGDNAVVIAMASRNLPPRQRQKAIIIGTGIAILMRIMLTTLAVYLLAVPYLQFIGGLFLLYLGYQLLIEKRKPSMSKAGHLCGRRFG